MASLAGCVTIDPYVVDGPAQKAFTNTPTYDAALAYAEGQKSEYYSAISEHAILNSGVGALLIPLTAWAGYQAFTSSNSNQLVGAGMIGAGLFGLSSFLYSKPRQTIYGAGVIAINCTLRAMAPLTDAYKDGSTFDAVANKEGAALVRLRGKVSDLGLRIDQIAADQTLAGPLTIDLQHARADLDMALTLVQRGDQARQHLQRAPQTLYFAVEQIRATVTRELLATEPDLQRLVASLGSTIPLTAGMLLNRSAADLPLPGTAAATTGTQRANDGDNRKELQAAVEKMIAEQRDALQDLRRETALLSLPVQNAVEVVGAAPDSRTLEDCAVKVENTGALFAVNPPGPITVKADANVAQEFTTSNGKLPYSTAWKGAVPNGVVVTPEVMMTGQGKIRLTGFASVTPEHYVLIVQDNAGGTKEVKIRVETASPPKVDIPAPPPAIPANLTCTLADWQAKSPLSDDEGTLSAETKTQYEALQRALNGFATAHKLPENCSGQLPMATDGTPGQVTTAFAIDALNKLGCEAKPNSVTIKQVTDAATSGAKSALPQACPIPGIASVAAATPATGSTATTLSCTLEGWQDKSPLSDDEGTLNTETKMAYATLQQRLSTFAAKHKIRPENCTGNLPLSANGVPDATTTALALEVLPRLKCKTEPDSYEIAEVNQTLVDLADQPTLPTTCPIS